MPGTSRRAHKERGMCDPHDNSSGTTLHGIPNRHTFTVYVNYTFAVRPGANRRGTSYPKPAANEGINVSPTTYSAGSAGLSAQRQAAEAGLSRDTSPPAQLIVDNSLNPKNGTRGTSPYTPRKLQGTVKAEQPVKPATIAVTLSDMESRRNPDTSGVGVDDRFYGESKDPEGVVPARRLDTREAQFWPDRSTANTRKAKQ